MGKHEPMTAKAIANRIKAKGLQKIKYYCEMCKKQCRDDNGFKCHIMSEAHQRQALIVSEDPEQFVNEFSKQFLDGFMFILKTRYRTKRILANTVFQEYIKDKQHIHMNGTRWTSLTEFANWMGEQGLVKVEESERGVLITYIDRDPESLKRQELYALRAQQAKEAAERTQKEIEQQIETTRKIYEQLETKVIPAEPIPIIKVEVPKAIESHKSQDEDQTSSRAPEPHPHNEIEASCSQDRVTTEILERPLFKVQTFSLKPTIQSNYKPPPPKRKKAPIGEAKRKKN